METNTTRDQVRTLAAEQGWQCKTVDAIDLFWVDRTAQGLDWSHKAVPTKWTPEGELHTVWLDGTATAADEFTCNGRFPADYLLAYVFDLKLAAEASE